MLNFPPWQRWLVIAICLIGVAITLPNLFYGRVERADDARAAIERGVPETPEMTAALAGWPSWLPSNLISLGLDLRGGAHVLVEVDLADAQADRVEGIWPDLRDKLRGLRDQVGTVRRLEGPKGELRIRIGDPAGLQAALQAIQEVSQPVFSLSGLATRDFTARAEGSDTVIVTLSEAEITAMNERTMQRSLEIIRRRVDETGTREPTIQRQGADRILIQVPGLGSAEELLAIIGQTARLSFHAVISRSTDPGVRPGLDQIVAPSMDEAGVFYVLDRHAVVTGEQLVDSQPGFDQNNRPAVNFRFNPQGGAAFGTYTAQNIGKPFAILLDNEVISAPVIQSHIAGGSGIITGSFTPEESARLAILLRAGALPAGIEVLEQRTIGPELGQDSIDAGGKAGLIAVGAVILYMVASYGGYGAAACLAMLINLSLIFALMTMIGATLTMPGIAGIVLTIGMAVDSNVLIFERVREEIRAGRGPARSLQTGFEKAFSSIVDANITTLIIAVILYFLGSGPVRGFAVTLGLGVLCTVFTAVYVTQLIIAVWFDRRRPKTITV